MIQRISQRVKKTGAAIALLSAEMILVLVIFLLALLALAYLIRNVIVLHRTGFDQEVFAYLKSHINPKNSDIMLFFTFFGTHKFLIPANLVLIAYFLFVQKHKWYAIKIPAIALSSLLLMFGLKHFFNRPRPDVPLIFKAEGLSFPSGHALFSITFYGLLVYIIFKSNFHPALKWTLIALLVLLMPVIGFSRVYLRVHYASDVIAGFCVGFMWLVLTIWFLNQIERHNLKKLDRVVKQS
jgi:undecaprenyl-diphosphatase